MASFPGRSWKMTFKSEGGSEEFESHAARDRSSYVTRSGANISPTELEAELKFSPYVSDALVVAGTDPNLGALIVIDNENVERWAQNKRIAFSDFTGLVRSDAVRDLIGADIARVYVMFVEPIRSFRLIEHRLEPEDPELTPMMKLRRRFVSEKYRALIEAMS